MSTGNLVFRESKAELYLERASSSGEVLESVASRLSSTRVCWFTDNQNVRFRESYCDTKSNRYGNCFEFWIETLH